MLQLLQLEGCSANYLLVKDRAIISATQEVVGCHWRHSFTASVIRFILYSLGRIYLQTHIWSWLYLYHLHPSFLPYPCPHAVKQQQTRHDFQPACIWEKGMGGVMEDWSWRRVKGKEDENLFCAQTSNCFTGQIGLIQYVCLTVNSTATQNAALCKSSVNASTLHSCSYFKQG